MDGRKKVSDEITHAPLLARRYTVAIHISKLTFLDSNLPRTSLLLAIPADAGAVRLLLLPADAQQRNLVGRRLGRCPS
jgi:hypothetical protein